MYLEKFRIFCDIVELESFSRAASKNSISQSAVSQQLAQLEQDFNASLLNRNTRPFQLTKIGEEFYKTCKEIIGSYSTFKTELNGVNHKPKQVFRVGVESSVCHYHVSAAMKSLVERYSDMNVHVVYEPYGTLKDLIMSKMVDIAIVDFVPQDRGVNVHCSIEEPLVVVCDPANPMFDRGVIQASGLSEGSFFSFPLDSETGKHVKGVFDSLNIRPGRITEYSDSELIMLALLSHNGFAVLPKVAVSNLLYTSGLRELEVVGLNLSRSVSVVSNSDIELAEPIRFFIEYFSKLSC